MIIQTTIQEVAFVVTALGLIQWILSIWVKTRLESSIKHEYDIQLQKYKFSQIQRQKAELIAQLFAKWIKYRGKERSLLTDKDLFDYYEDLNRLSIEISLWVKDVDLLNSIMDRLVMGKNAESVHTLIGKVRKLILETEDTFDSDHIAIWPKPEEVGDVFHIKDNS